MINMDRGRVRPTTMSHNMAALLGLILSFAALVYSVYFWYWTSMLWSIDTCQNKVSADQCHVTILRAQVLVFFWSWPLTKCWFSIESQAHVLLICGDQGQTVRKVVNGNQVDRSMNFSSIQMFFTALESWAPGVVRHYSTSKQKANLYTQKTLNAKLKNSVQIPAYRGIA